METVSSDRAPSRHRRRKRLKAGQRARIWSHKVKDALLSAAGHGIARALRRQPARVFTQADIRAWLDAPAAREAYGALQQRLNALAGDNRRHSVGAVDCFALFALTKGAKATKALEIGTHLGFSTLHIAAALSANGVPARLTTVDMLDVNDERQAAYKTYGATMSARERLRLLGFDERVEFVVSASDVFLKRTSERYDLIFVDGDHSEAGAYFDILQSLMRLNDNGIVVLHDMNDPDDPTPGLAPGLYGVHWAIHRLRAYIPDLDVIRLRSVTPPGMGGPMATSLAVLTRRPRSG